MFIDPKKYSSPELYVAAVKADIAYQNRLRKSAGLPPLTSSVGKSYPAKSPLKEFNVKPYNANSVQTDPDVLIRRLQKKNQPLNVNRVNDQPVKKLHSINVVDGLISTGQALWAPVTWVREKTDKWSWFWGPTLR
jgi:hypothetical protein